MMLGSFSPYYSARSVLAQGENNHVVRNGFSINHLPGLCLQLLVKDSRPAGRRRIKIPRLSLIKESNVGSLQAPRNRPQQFLPGFGS